MLELPVLELQPQTSKLNPEDAGSRQHMEHKTQQSHPCMYRHLATLHLQKVLQQLSFATLSGNTKGDPDS